jgi:ribosomal-protein-alanine N-acetyltransferase
MVARPEDSREADDEVPAAAEVDLESLAVQLVPMRRRHLRGVMRIERQVYPRPWTAVLFAQELALTTSRAYYVARVDAEVVGYAGLMFTGEDGHVTNIAVEPGWQGRKIAQRLLANQAREALRRHARHLTLEVRVSNTAAQGLYRKFGFAPAGVRRGYYVESNEDALIMWANDIDTPAYQARLARLEDEIPGLTVVHAIRP